MRAEDKKTGGGPTGPASREQQRPKPDLPLTARAAAGLAAGVTGVRLHELTCGLRDGEVVTRLRGTHDLIRVGRARGHVDLAASRAQRDPAVLQVLSSVGAIGVVLLLRVAGLDVRNDVTRVRLGLGVLTLLTLTEEGRQRDSGQNTDDENHNEELDEREALLLVVHALAKHPQHLSPP